LAQFVYKDHYRLSVDPTRAQQRLKILAPVPIVSTQRIDGDEEPNSSDHDGGVSLGGELMDNLGMVNARSL
jgi:hypothetical protein